MTGGTPATDYLSLDDLLEIGAGVIGEVRVRELGALESCTVRPQTIVLGEEAYPTLADKAAALLHAIARNDPLVDGNKCLTWSALRTFLLLNDHDVRPSVDDAEELVIAVATGSMDVPEIAAWLSTHLRRA